MEAKKEKLGTENAYPFKLVDGSYENGMSRRLLLAGMAMQGMLSNMEFLKANAITAKQNDTTPDEFLVKTSYSLADELLRQENL